MWLSYRTSAFEMIAFTGLYLALFLLVGRLFFLGGAAASAALALYHWRLGSRARKAAYQPKPPSAPGAPTEAPAPALDPAPELRKMQLKAENPVRFLKDNAPAVIAAYFEATHLKQLYRQGWLRRGVPPERCESVAEHTFGVALLALWLAPQIDPAMDAGRSLRMALIHDFGEVYAGDIIPADAISAAEKRRLESESIRTVFSRLPDGQAYMDLWEEYEAGVSAEARFVRQIDRLEMGLQAAVYRHAGMMGMDEFLASARQALSDPGLLELIQAIIEEDRSQ
jgi:putative hydrolase of HD superfamily